jgi:SNF2 family DNA or RNA helicase
LVETEGWKCIVPALRPNLEQVYNDPAQLLHDNSTIGGRSGKVARLGETLEEVIKADDKSLIFTQFAEMESILRCHLEESFGREVLWLRGEVPNAQRDRSVDRYQSPGGGHPCLFVLSLKAGGTGLNLTAANHVFHFDRWWNPAVENQATDRDFRIGQKSNVQVHKFIMSRNAQGNDRRDHRNQAQAPDRPFNRRH